MDSNILFELSELLGPDLYDALHLLETSQMVIATDSLMQLGRSTAQITDDHFTCQEVECRRRSFCIHFIIFTLWKLTYQKGNVECS